MIALFGNHIAKAGSIITAWVGDKYSRRSEASRNKRLSRLRKAMELFQEDLANRERQIVVILAEMGAAAIKGVLSIICFIGSVSVLVLTNFDDMVSFFHIDLPRLERILMRPGGQREAIFYDNYAYPIEANILLVFSVFFFLSCSYQIRNTRRFLDPQAYIMQLQSRIALVTKDAPNSM